MIEPAMIEPAVIESPMIDARATRRSLLAASSAALILGAVLASDRVRADAGTHLGAAIPADVHLYARSAMSPAQERIAAAFFRAWRRLAASGILDDIIDLATTEASPAQKEQVRGVIARVRAVLSKVPFSKLASREAAIGFRFRFPIPEYLFLFRAPPAVTEASVQGFREIFTEVKRLAGPALEVSESELAGTAVVTLGPRGAPVGIDVAARGDVLAISVSRGLLQESLSLLAGKTPPSGIGAIVDSERYRRLTAGLPGKRDGESIFDIAGYLGVFEPLLGLAANTTGQDPAAAAVLDLARDLLEEIKRLGVVASAQWAEENRVHSEAHLVLREDFRDSFFYPAFASREPLEGIERFIPADVTSFAFTSGVDLEKLLDLTIKVIRERIPGGERILERLERVQDRIGFHLRRDLLAWLDGACGHIVLPSESGGRDVVFLARVKDDELARRKLRAFALRVARFLESRGQPISFEPVEGLSPEFRAIRIDAFPDCVPVAGVTNGVLLLATSAHAVARIGAGDHFTGVPGLRVADLPPPCAASYADIENQLRGAAQLMTGAGFVLSILPRSRHSRPLLKLGAILTKLGRFVRDVDLGIETASWTTFDADRGRVITRTVTSLKVPEPPRVEVEPGFTPLFNGHDLEGWVIENGGRFSVRDGLLFVDHGTGWLRSEKTYGDFVLRLDVRFLEERANSGIFVRTAATSKDDENGWPDNGYQIQCMDTTTGAHPIATMIPYGAPPFVHESDLEKIAAAYRPTGEWNTFEITCKGKELAVKLNGVPVTRARDIENVRGHIGIQGEHGLLEFRNIRIKELD